MRIFVWIPALIAITAGHAAAAPAKLDLRAVPVPAPTFSFMPESWQSFATPGDLTPRGAQAEAFATSWRYRLTTIDGPAGSIPRDAILASVSLIRTNPGKETGSLCARTARGPP